MRQMVGAQRVRKHYGASEALSGVDLRVDAGEVVAIIGPSGSGKSTLLRCLNGLETITSGRITVGDEVLCSLNVAGHQDHRASRKELQRIRTTVGMVFQRYNLFAHMTAIENICEAQVQVLGRPRKAAEERAIRLLEQVNLGHRAGHFPEHMSGGEQQRVAIARALAMEPEVMLFDEVTSALDPETVGDVLEVMRSLAEAGMTMAVVTHEIRFAREVADSVVVMEDGQIIDRGPTADILERPTHARTREFLSRVLSH
jgi:polar amino acid transport system ATP-binding protein